MEGAPSLYVTDWKNKIYEALWTQHPRSSGTCDRTPCNRIQRSTTKIYETFTTRRKNQSSSLGTLEIFYITFERNKISKFLQLHPLRKNKNNQRVKTNTKLNIKKDTSRCLLWNQTAGVIQSDDLPTRG